MTSAINPLSERSASQSMSCESSKNKFGTCAHLAQFLNSLEDSRRAGGSCCWHCLPQWKVVHCGARQGAGYLSHVVSHITLSICSLLNFSYGFLGASRWNRSLGSAMGISTVYPARLWCYRNTRTCTLRGKSFEGHRFISGTNNYMWSNILHHLTSQSV